jgi:hypothetical protein
VPPASTRPATSRTTPAPSFHRATTIDPAITPTPPTNSPGARFQIWSAQRRSSA